MNVTNQAVCTWGEKSNFFSFQTFFFTLALYVAKAELHGVEGGNRDKRRLRLIKAIFFARL